MKVKKKFFNFETRSLPDKNEAMTRRGTSGRSVNLSFEIFNFLLKFFEISSLFLFPQFSIFENKTVVLNTLVGPLLKSY